RGGVRPAGHEIVHQVVAVRHAVKNVVHQRLLALERHPPEAEIGMFARARHGFSPAETIARRRGGRYVSPGSSLTMPELPEVETVRRALAPVLQAARFTHLVAHRGDLRWPLAKDFAARLEGKT